MSCEALHKTTGLKGKSIASKVAKTTEEELGLLAVAMIMLIIGDLTVLLSA